MAQRMREWKCAICGATVACESNPGEALMSCQTAGNYKHQWQIQSRGFLGRLLGVRSGAQAR